MKYHYVDGKSSNNLDLLNIIRRILKYKLWFTYFSYYHISALKMFNNQSHYLIIWQTAHSFMEFLSNPMGNMSVWDWQMGLYEKGKVEMGDQELTEITIETEIKKCKQCKFTARTMNVLKLHLENDHGYDFQCAECGKKFPFKNQLKLHRREVHEEGSFSCFVCNKNFLTHKELKQPNYC